MFAAGPQFLKRVQHNVFSLLSIVNQLIGEIAQSREEHIEQEIKCPAASFLEAGDNISVHLLLHPDGQHRYWIVGEPISYYIKTASGVVFGRPVMCQQLKDQVRTNEIKSAKEGIRLRLQDIVISEFLLTTTSY